MDSNLEGLTIDLYVSDPWEFGTQHGCGPFPAKILKQKSSNTILIELENVLTFKETPYQYLVVDNRHQGVDFNLILKGEDVPIDFIRIDEDQIHSEDPFDVSWWRGGHAGIGSIELKE